MDAVARKVRPWRDFEPIDERQRRGFTFSLAQSARRLLMIKTSAEGAIHPQTCGEDTSRQHRVEWEDTAARTSSALLKRAAPTYGFTESINSLAVACSVGDTCPP